MRIAVAYQNGEIYEHFGHAKFFAVYDYPGADVDRCTKKLIETGDRNGHADMAALMRDERIDAVIVGNMGEEAKAALLGYGIVPIVGYSGSADDAADLLILGQLPVLQGECFCSGGCTGCGECGGCDSHFSCGI